MLHLFARSRCNNVSRCYIYLHVVVLVLKLLSFKIGLREDGFYSGRTDTQTESLTDEQIHPVPYFNIDLTWWHSTIS